MIQDRVEIFEKNRSVAGWFFDPKEICERRYIHREHVVGSVPRGYDTVPSILQFAPSPFAGGDGKLLYPSSYPLGSVPNCSGSRFDFVPDPIGCITKGIPGIAENVPTN